MSCTDSLLLHVSVGRGDLPMESRGTENSSLHSGWHSLHGASAGNTGAVQPCSLMGQSGLKTAKCVIFATSISATTWSITEKIILTALLPYSLITAHPARMGGGE